MGRITGLCDGLPSSPEAVCQVARKEDYQRVLLNVINELRKHCPERNGLPSAPCTTGALYKSKMGYVHVNFYLMPD